MTSASFKLHFSRTTEMHPETIEILANDGKISANKTFLRFASQVVHTRLMEDPDTIMIDLKNYRKSSIDCLLTGIYTGKTTFSSVVEEEEVKRLCLELDISILEPGVAGENIKVDAPEVPEEEQVKNEDPGLMRLDDGKVSCGLCFKVFSRMGDAKRHYQNVHIAKNKEKTIICKAPNCDKKFNNMGYMKIHMLQKHGISAKMIPGNVKAGKKSTKKVSASKKVKEEMEVKKELIED